MLILETRFSKISASKQACSTFEVMSFHRGHKVHSSKWKALREDNYPKGTLI